MVGNKGVASSQTSRLETANFGGGAISFFRMGTRGIGLDVALRQSGAGPDVARLASVTVRPAPPWLAQVWGTGTDAMTVRNVVFASRSALERIADGDALVLLSHEAVHVEQWREHGVVRFLVRYLGDYVRGRAVGLPHHVAYRAIRFEREAVERSERG
jgi:hypothetical protein